MSIVTSENKKDHDKKVMDRKSSKAHEKKEHKYEEHDYESMSDEAKELSLHADNNEHLHRSSHIPIVKNLQKKHAKGEYNQEKARKLWGYHADRAAQSYHKEHGTPNHPWHKMFSKEHRKQAAHHFENHHRGEVEDYTNYK